MITGTTGIELHATVRLPGGAIKTACGGGVTVIVLETGTNGLPHISVAVHVSVMVPPHKPGLVVKVDGFEVPEMRQLPL